MHWRNRFYAVLAACCVSALAWAQADTLVAGAFSALKPGATLPQNWKPLGVGSTIPRTRYSLVDDGGGTTVIKAEANASAAGLIRSIKVNLAEFPTLTWRWKISNLYKNSDIRSKQGDDYPARVYVMFDYPLEKLSFIDRIKLRIARALHPNLPSATICYVWDNTAPAGTIVASSYTSLVRMIVVESGASRVNQWLAPERDVAADFKAAFGDAAPPVIAVAIATDSDNTGESAVAFYGDISFYKQKVTQ